MCRGVYREVLVERVVGPVGRMDGCRVGSALDEVCRTLRWGMVGCRDGTTSYNNDAGVSVVYVDIDIL